MIRVTTLANSLDPIRDWFNQQPDLTRVLAIQSAT